MGFIKEYQFSIVENCTSSIELSIEEEDLINVLCFDFLKMTDFAFNKLGYSEIEVDDMFSSVNKIGRYFHESKNSTFQKVFNAIVENFIYTFREMEEDFEDSIYKDPVIHAIEYAIGVFYELDDYLTSDDFYNLKRITGIERKKVA